MMEKQKRNMRGNILQTLKDCKLMKCHRLDSTGIMFVVDTLTSPTQPFNAIIPEPCSAC